MTTPLRSLYLSSLSVACCYRWITVCKWKVRADHSCMCTNISDWDMCSMAGDLSSDSSQYSWLTLSVSPIQRLSFQWQNQCKQTSVPTLSVFAMSYRVPCSRWSLPVVQLQLSGSEHSAGVLDWTALGPWEINIKTVAQQWQKVKRTKLIYLITSNGKELQTEQAEDHILW